MRALSKFLPSALFALAFLPFTATLADDQHHLPEGEAQQPSPQMPMMMPMMNMMGQPPAGMPMMNMMGQGGMSMMNMMGQGGMDMMSAMPMGGMPMPDMGAHLEGRIAFLRAELDITDAQALQWEAFAQALRDSAAKLKQAQAAASTGPIGFVDRVERQEQWLTVRLEGLKAIKAAVAQLEATLSEDQKKTAETLLTRPACFGPMGML
jgi:hypothetical protein